MIVFIYIIIITKNSCSFLNKYEYYDIINIYIYIYIYLYM
jgi:hypothetical protein